MGDQRVAVLSRNLRAQGYLDNDPDATLVAMRLIALADALEEQHQPVMTVTPPEKR
jgi:hypothetical protein